jgi:hypothetical protein
VVRVDGGVSTFEVAAPFAECFHEGVELLFPRGVSGDGIRMFSGEEADGVWILGGGGTLKKNSTHSKVGGVRIDFEGK